MAKWLSTEWLEETRALWSANPGWAGLSSRIRFEITGGPDGGASCSWALRDGTLVECGSGPAGDPDLTVTLGWDDAVSVQRGELDPSVAFMQGRMKVAGSMEALMALLPATRTPEFHELLRQVEIKTEF